MENRAHAMAAGIFVTVLTVLLVVLAAWLSRDTGERDIYEISTRETVTGLQAQAPVRYRGVDVGKVATIGFDPKATGHVLLRLEVDAGAPITADTFATLGFQGVTGLAFVQLDDTGKPAPRLAPNDEVPPRIPLQPGLLSKLTTKGEVILDQVEQVTVRMNELLGPPNQQKVGVMLENLGQAAASVSSASDNLTRVLNAQLGPDRVSIPALVKNVNATVVSLQGTARSATVAINEVGQTARSLNAKDGPIQRLAEGSAALSHAAEAFNASTLPRLNRATEDTSRAVRQLGRTVNNINDNPQSLIFGTGAVDPGPGEPGFAPSVRPATK
jgi:phospholipid/cholesterol/gamma-HCH transport system substrate-binding protein